jgi:hypothetical protein
MPTYFGISPPKFGCGGYPWCNRDQPYGSWWLHLLPYIEQDNVYNLVDRDCTTNHFNEPQYTGGSPGTSVSCFLEHHNGHDLLVCVSNGSSGSLVRTDGIWIDGVHEAAYQVLHCPSDPVWQPPGQVYGGYWGATCYLANWNAWGDGTNGLWTLPVNFTAIEDGLSNTIMFGEGFSTCDGLGRIALYSWYYHNFGLNQENVPNTLKFQVRPGLGTCETCCDNWRAQTAHSAMNVGLADGSVRTVSGAISQTTWDYLLLPRDHQVIGSDW